MITHFVSFLFTILVLISIAFILGSILVFCVSTMVYLFSFPFVKGIAVAILVFLFINHYKPMIGKGKSGR